MRRKTAKQPLQVTSFRLPPDVKAFLHERATAEQRTMSFVLVEVLRLYINYVAEQKKQPKVSK